MPVRHHPPCEVAWTRPRVSQWAQSWFPSPQLGQVDDVILPKDKVEPLSLCLILTLLAVFEYKKLKYHGLR